MNDNDRGRYLAWLREVLKEKYAAVGNGWQDHNADLDEFLDGFYEEVYKVGYGDAKMIYNQAQED